LIAFPEGQQALLDRASKKLYRHRDKERMTKSILLLLITILIAGCTGGKTAPASVLVEEYAVYEAAIESLYLTEDIELIVIKNRTATDSSPSESLDTEVAYIQEEFGSAIESETLSDYRARNKQSHQLDQDFLLDVPYVLLSEAELAETFERGGGWNQFYKIYPNSQGIMTLSRVGFNTQIDQALVYIGNQAGYLAGRGYYVLLTKEGDVWTVDNMIVAWIS
jgi:hypothetical protein